MSTITCRQLPITSEAGPYHMAADEVLLESAVGGIASLRFYTWTEATLSLGYFQPSSVRVSEPRLALLPCVRRPSGGRALVHHHELTYALALPAGPPWQKPGPSESWLCRMHALIATALSNWGVQVQTAQCAIEPQSSSQLCFQHSTPGDLLMRTVKVVGSAQRRQRGALLQHGAVLLETSPWAPELKGLTDLGSGTIPTETLANAIAQTLERQTGWKLIADEWTTPEKTRTEELIQTKYTQDAWSLMR